MPHPILIAAMALLQAPDDAVTLHGIGALRIGASEAELGRMGAVREDPPDDESDCTYWHLPDRDGLALMVAGGRLVRIDIQDAAYRTRSGAHVGMGEAEIRALYGRAMRVQPHPYEGPEGHYLVYRAASEPYGMIVETDGRTAQSLRVGLWENVQWIEGCS